MPDSITDREAVGLLPSKVLARPKTYDPNLCLQYPVPGCPDCLGSGPDSSQSPRSSGPPYGPKPCCGQIVGEGENKPLCLIKCEDHDCGEQVGMLVIWEKGVW